MSKLPRGTFHPPLQCPAATSACSQAAKLLASFAASKPVSITFRNCRVAPFTQIPFHSGSKLPRGTFHPPLTCPAATSACSQAAKLLASFAASKPVSITFRNCRVAPFTQIPFHSGSKLPRGTFHPPLTCPAAASQNSAPAPKTCFYSMSKLPRGACRCSQLPKPASIAFRSCRVLHFTTHPWNVSLQLQSVRETPYQLRRMARNSLPAVMTMRKLTKSGVLVHHGKPQQTLLHLPPDELGVEARQGSSTPACRASCRWPPARRTGPAFCAATAVRGTEARSSPLGQSTNSRRPWLAWCLARPLGKRWDQLEPLVGYRGSCSKSQNIISAALTIQSKVHL